MRIIWEKKNCYEFVGIRPMGVTMVCLQVKNSFCVKINALSVKHHANTT